MKKVLPMAREAQYWQRQSNMPVNQRKRSAGVYSQNAHKSTHKIMGYFGSDWLSDAKAGERSHG
jgi:hypothetical protein